MQLTDGGRSIGSWFTKKVQRTFIAQPELSKAFTRWQAYMQQHIDALSHSPPHFSVLLTSTLHDADEKCDVSGVCIAIVLPLRVMGMDDQHSTTYGMLPGHDIVVCVEVGRQLSSSPTAMAFHYNVQVFTVASAVGSEHHGSVSCMRDRSSFPLACLLRHKVAALLEGYAPFFPGPTHPSHPLHSFPSCLQSLVQSYVSAAANSRRSLLSLVGGALPENPIVHVMRELQTALREASRDCVVCGQLLVHPTGMGYDCCGDGLCDEALLSSPYTARVVHGFLHSRLQQLHLFLHVLTAAVGISHFGPVPTTVIWRRGWLTQRFTNRAEVAEALGAIPLLDELVLYDEDELAKQLDQVHCSLLPLLAWVICTYRTSLFSLPSVSMKAGPARNVHHMVVSMRSTMLPAETEAYVLELAELSQPSTRSLAGLCLTTLFDGGQPSQLFVSGGLWLLHLVLAQHGILSATVIHDLGKTSCQLQTTLRYHRHFVPAAEAALSTLRDQRSTALPPDSRWKSSLQPAYACVLLIEQVTEQQLHAMLQPSDKRTAALLCERPQPKWWLLRAVYTITEAEGEEQRQQREAEAEHDYERGHAATERRPSQSDRSGVNGDEWYDTEHSYSETSQQQWRHRQMTLMAPPLYDADEEQDEKKQNRDGEEEQEEEEEEEDGEDGQEEAEVERNEEVAVQGELHLFDWSLEIRDMHSTSLCTVAGCDEYSIDQQLSLDATSNSSDESLDNPRTNGNGGSH